LQTWATLSTRSSGPSSDVERRAHARATRDSLRPVGRRLHVRDMETDARVCRSRRTRCCKDIGRTDHPRRRGATGGGRFGTLHVAGRTYVQIGLDRKFGHGAPRRDRGVARLRRTPTIGNRGAIQRDPCLLDGLTGKLHVEPAGAFVRSQVFVVTESDARRKRGPSIGCARGQEVVHRCGEWSFFARLRGVGTTRTTAAEYENEGTPSLHLARTVT
jgi:hypothetical protein